MPTDPSTTARPAPAAPSRPDQPGRLDGPGVPEVPGLPADLTVPGAPGVVVRALPVPASLDDPEAWLLDGMVDCVNDSVWATWGTRDFFRTPHEALGSLHSQRYAAKLRFVAVDEGAAGAADEPGRVLGYAALDLPRQDNTHTGELDIAVRPPARGRGIGTALHDAALAVALAHGRTHLIAETEQTSEPADGVSAVVPSTGTGRLHADDPNVRFMQRHGWALEQVTRYSVLDVPVADELLATHREAATAAAGPDYRVLFWEGSCPEDRVDQFALLMTRMSTDAPLGGLALNEDTWDAARVRTLEQQLADRGIGYLVAAVEHVPTGTLAAFSAVDVTPVTDEFVFQDDTLVLREHRGHRLGMLVKVANLDRLAAERPSLRRIGTWNAEENAHMLAINVALGFRPSGGTGEWQRTL